MKAQRGLKKFSGGWWLVVVHKVIIVSVRVLYVGFSVSLVFGVSVFGFFGFSCFRVFRFFGTLCFAGRYVFRTGWDAELDNLGPKTIFT